MLSIEQCRAARGLLGWTQQDLADVCGLSKTAINNFEKGYSDIKMESLRAIRMAFESANIEFTPGDGLRRKSEQVTLFRGATAMNDLLMDIFSTLRDSGGEVLVAHIDSSITNRVEPKQILEHLERMKAFKISKRIICAEGSAPVLAPLSHCRWLPKTLGPAFIPCFVYGDKVAFELWGGNIIVQMESKDAARAERERFELLWAAAVTPPSVLQNTQHTAAG